MPTLQAYRQYIAKELGLFQASTSGPSSTPGALVDPSWPVTSSIPQDDYWTDSYLLRPNAALASDKVRLVKSYAPATGTLTPDTNWANAPIAGEAYELHGVLEPLNAMTDAINQALKRTLVRSEITGTPINQQARHSLTSLAPWLSDPAWVRQVGWLASTEDRNKIDPYVRVVRGLAVEDETAGVSGVALTHPGFFWNGTETLYVRVIKRGYDHCRPPILVNLETITAATNATPIVITDPSHGYQSNQAVTITNVLGNTAANSTWFVTVVDANTYSLNGSTGNATYVSGGTSQLKTVFGDQSGLALDTDEAPINLEWLGAAALVEIWRRFGQVLETASRARQLPNLVDAAARFSHLTHTNFLPWPCTFVPLAFGGPMHARSANFGWA